MTRHRLFALPLFVVLLSAVVLAARGTGAQGEQYDLVLMGGRVLDPETGLDAKRNVGIRDGRIAAVTVEPLTARETLAVAGLVVAPGFIDLHAHGQDSESYRYYAHDGVTTALELEIGTYPVAPWYAERDGRALINYGVSAGHVGARRALIAHDESLPGVGAITRDTSRSWTHGALPDADLPRLDSLVERGAGKSVPEVFSSEGEAGFRNREMEAVRAAARGPRSVISVGGGALGSRAVRLAVRMTGHLLWLRAPVALCAERAATGRPLLAGNPQARLADLAIAREPLYARLADAVLDVVPGASPQLISAQAASVVSALEEQRAHH